MVRLLKNLFRKRPNPSDSTKPAVQQPKAGSSQPTDALEKFLGSMKIGYMEWHDGVGYDLKALRELSPEALKQLESLLIARKDRDWRDADALAALNTPATIEALKECVNGPNIEVKLHAVRHLKEMNIVDRVEEVVLDTLPTSNLLKGFTRVLALAKDYPTERIKETLLWCSLNGNTDIRVHCAAMVLYLYGKAASEFDKDQKIIYQFRTQDKAQRLEAFSELCQIIGVEPNRFAID